MITAEQKEILPVRAVLTALVAALLVFSWVFFPPAAPAQDTKPTKKPIVVRGLVQKVRPQARQIVIEGVLYYIGEKLTVKDKEGEILPDYKLYYLSWAYEVEIVTTDYVISEIKILKLTS